MAVLHCPSAFGNLLDQPSFLYGDLPSGCPREGKLYNSHSKENQDFTAVEQTEKRTKTELQTTMAIKVCLKISLFGQETADSSTYHC